MLSRPNNSTSEQDNLSNCRERVINNNVGLKPTLAMLFALLVVVGTILYIGFQNSANAAPEQVNFNGVTLRNGAKVYANGGQSLTAINSGANLVANTSSTTAVKGDAIASSLTSYTSSTYGNDTLFKSNTASNAKSLSEAQLNSFSSYLPTVNSDYWLSNTGARGSITWQSYATKDNKLTNNTLKATGKVDDFEYDDTVVTKGTYAYNKDLTMSNYVTSAGGRWDLGATGVKYFRVYYTNQTWFWNGSTVYNNPYCYSSGVDSNGNAYRSSTVRNLASGSGGKVFGYVSSGNRVTQVSAGQTFPAGTVFVFGFMKVYKEITDPTGFLIPPSYTWTAGWGSVSYIGFIKSTKQVTVSSNSAETQPLYGIVKYYDSATTIKGQNIASATKAVRPVYDYTSGNVAFSRTAATSSSLTTTNRFGNMPTSSVSSSDSTKLVVKSSDTTISDAISTSNLSTDKTSKGHGSLSYDSGVIKVPYGSKTLTINSDAFTTANANYISALANAVDGKKYALLGRAGTNLTIDLSSIVNVNQVGSKADVSFYAESANSARTTDSISAVPVSVQIEIVEGEPQTINYTNGGGTGTPPASATVKAGKAYSFASGTGLTKNGDGFNRWLVTYTPYGETTQTIEYVRSGGMLIIPDTADGKITATATFVGMSAKKSTDSVETVITVTWDTNAPAGTTATFTGDGTFNDAKTQRYDKIKLAGSSVAVPSEPTISIDTKIFDGWYTSASGGTKVTAPTVSPTVNTVYYAHWIDAYRITWDATGGSGLVDPTIAGKFSNGDTKIYENVIPGNVVVGPKLAGAVAEPVPADSSITGYSFLGWYTQPNGGGTKVTLGTTKPSANTTYYAYVVRGYKVTYVVTGGTGATQTGKWADGTTANYEEIVLPGKSTVGPSSAKGTPVANNSSYMFYAWYTQPNGQGTEFKTGTSFASLGGSKTVYAYYGLANTFLAPASTTANPRNISGTKYSIKEVKAAADSIKSGSNPNSTVYNATNDSYHLYTLLKDSSGNFLDASKKDNWAEFRIIGVGDHDGDGSGLTFQMVHGMPVRYAYDSNGSKGANLNWAKSTLRPLLQSGGSIYNQFDTQLTRRIMPVAKKYNTKAGSTSGVSTTNDAFSILSYTEYQKSVNSSYWTTGKLGSTYAFWNKYTIANDSAQTLDPLQKLCSTRSGTLLKESSWSVGFAWQRSVSPNYSDSVLRVNSIGYLGSYGYYQTNEIALALSFSL